MLAYHFPPLAGGSGQHRTLAFARYLQEYGWEPVILTVTPRAHEYCAASTGNMGFSYPVHRAFALDSSRHLAIGGRYPEWLAQPDRWISWWLTGVPLGLSLIKRYRPRAIWSTFPIATAHLIALSLTKFSGLPWLADQRDPLYEQDYPPQPMRYKLHRWLEHALARRASRIVCTSAGSQRLWLARYPHRHDDDIALIPNGYDEADFAPQAARPHQDAHTQEFILLHSGVVYPSERNPTALFHALAMLMETGEISAASFRLRLRASEHTGQLLQMLARHDGLMALVELAPMLPHAQAIAELGSVSGLLLLQASNCNGQIPAKLYEYLRSGQPILALTDSQGDTAQLLRKAGIDTLAPLDDTAAIMQALRRFLALSRCGRAPIADSQFVAGLTRQTGGHQLAQLLDDVSGDAR